MKHCPLCTQVLIASGDCDCREEVTEGPPNKAIDLGDLNKAELLSIAKGFESITGESHMTKSQLIEAIEAAK